MKQTSVVLSRCRNRSLCFLELFGDDDDFLFVFALQLLMFRLRPRQLAAHAGRSFSLFFHANAQVFEIRLDGGQLRLCLTSQL